jgi:Rod binding domain-containing protein
MLYQLLKQMWNSIPESKVLPNGNAGKMFREMRLEKVADQASTAGDGIGIARTVEAQLLDRARHSFSPEQAAEQSVAQTARP